MSTPRWARCIYHRGQHSEEFLRDYLSEPHRKVLLIAGAGFDPRSTAVARKVAQYASNRTAGYFLREERPSPDAALVARGDANETVLRQLIPDCSVIRLDVFAPDDAVVGGRTAARLIGAVALGGLTDVIVDFSALSIGVAFPIVRYLLAAAEAQGLNLHLILVDEPGTDTEIRSAPTDRADAIHGFRGDWELDGNARAALLWMPQLAWGKRAVLERIHQRVQPHAVCPILPFPPTDDPRLPDRLVEHYATEFENTWEVDHRDIVYASQRRPLDLYRTILRMDDSRKRVFAEIGGSLVTLTEDGSTPIIFERIRRMPVGEVFHRFSWRCPNCGARLPGYKPVLAVKAEELIGTLDSPQVFFLDRLSRGAIILARAAAERGAAVFFEPSSLGNPLLFREAWELADVVKYSHERLSELPGDLEERKGPKLLIETLGKEGLRYRTRLPSPKTWTWRHMESIPAVRIRDTAGAGDWCTAGLIHRLFPTGASALDVATDGSLRDALRYSQALSAWTCGFEGARGGMYEVEKGQFREQVASLLGTSSNRKTDTFLHKVAADKTMTRLCPSCEVLGEMAAPTETETDCGYGSEIQAMLKA